MKDIGYKLLLPVTVPAFLFWMFWQGRSGR